LASTYYFLAAPGDHTVLEWFREKSSDLLEVEGNNGVSLLFREFGSLQEDSSGEISASSSPLVSVFLPHYRRGALLTVGEVHFLTTNLRSAFPGLERIRAKFQTWLKGMVLAFEWRRDLRPEEWYHFEVGILNVATRISALPSAEPSLADGTYFIAQGASEQSLDDLCRTLRLRGVQCE
jgi:hypothetical protein